jgi:hypothetical protein
MRIVDAVPTSRRHKATRCRHCEFCHPRGVVSGVARCAEPERDGLIVMADQMACGHYEAVQAVLLAPEPPRAEMRAPVLKAPEASVLWRQVVVEPSRTVGAPG